MIVIQIPVKKHVKKYLVARYGETHKISKKSFIGLFLLNLLEKKHEKPDWFESEPYVVEVPEYYFNTKGHSVNRNHLRSLGVVLEKIFMDDFYDFVDLELRRGNNAMQSVKLFLNIYSISENELKLESMYRNYQRYSNEKIKEKKCKLIQSFAIN